MLALALAVSAAVVLFGLVCFGLLFDEYGGEAAAPPVNADHVATAGAAIALVATIACIIVRRRRPGLAAAGLAVIAVITPVAFILSRDNTAGAMVVAWPLVALLLLCAAAYLALSRRMGDEAGPG